MNGAETIWVIILVTIALIVVFCCAIFCLIKCKESSEDQMRDDDDVEKFRDNRSSRMSLRRSTMHSTKDADGLILNQDLDVP